MIDSPPVLEVDVELGEFQLHIIDIVQEEHEDAHVVVPVGQGEQGGRRVGQWVDVSTQHPWSITLGADRLPEQSRQPDLVAGWVWH